jgi:hypothetical protein
VTTVVLFAMWLSAQAAPDAATVAKALEEKAFAAIERKDWCEATFLFEEANAASPTADYLFNAARAAENAEDIPRALMLYKLATGGTRAKEAKQKLSVLEKRSGSTKACVAPAPPVEEPPPPPPPPEVVVVAPPPVQQPGPSVGTVAGIILVPTGSLLVVGGGIAAVLGAMPLLRFSDAQSALDKAAANGVTDPDELAALQQKQGIERAAWEGPLGRPLLIGGVIGVGVGVAVVATGIALWVAAE